MGVLLPPTSAASFPRIRIRPRVSIIIRIAVSRILLFVIMPTLLQHLALHNLLLLHHTHNSITSFYKIALRMHSTVDSR
ncbi:hypothetical protein BV25DRAFT_156251 [Artomyces pyxidatus]|uniref:Uncharacterized protein n=1 Tax=Artomyces pyxidatus TaxID=48021 RepID=A0ACB8TAR0_9AGAM|nr:hypothetical protein BV25DRAFT_156251 [Artomyces pyxidatus]